MLHLNQRLNFVLLLFYLLLLAVAVRLIHLGYIGSRCAGLIPHLVSTGSCFTGDHGLFLAANLGAFLDIHSEAPAVHQNG